MSGGKIWAEDRALVTRDRDCSCKQVRSPRAGGGGEVRKGRQTSRLGTGSKAREGDGGGPGREEEWEAHEGTPLWTALSAGKRFQKNGQEQCGMMPRGPVRTCPLNLETLEQTGQKPNLSVSESGTDVKKWIQ